jgi:hypothetical protein
LTAITNVVIAAAKLSRKAEIVRTGLPLTCPSTFAAPPHTSAYDVSTTPQFVR